MEYKHIEIPGYDKQFIVKYPNNTPMNVIFKDVIKRYSRFGSTILVYNVYSKPKSKSANMVIQGMIWNERGKYYWGSSDKSIKMFLNPKTGLFERVR